LHRFDFRSADASAVAIGVVRDTHGPKRLGDPVSDLYLAIAAHIKPCHNCGPQVNRRDRRRSPTFAASGPDPADRVQNQYLL